MRFSQDFPAPLLLYLGNPQSVFTIISGVFGTNEKAPD